jgi:hypothetical protein
VPHRSKASEDCAHSHILPTTPRQSPSLIPTRSRKSNLPPDKAEMNAIGSQVSARNRVCRQTGQTLLSHKATSAQNAAASLRVLARPCVATERLIARIFSTRPPSPIYLPQQACDQTSPRIAQNAVRPTRPEARGNPRRVFTAYGAKACAFSVSPASERVSAATSASPRAKVDAPSGQGSRASDGAISE